MVTVIGEIGIIAALPIVFVGLGGFDFRAVFSVRKIPLFTLFLCMVLGLAAQLAIVCPNTLGIWLLQQIGRLYIAPDSSLNFNISDKIIFSVAALVLAPLCEETLNRGFLMAGYKRFGLVRTILVIGVLFGLFHMYPYKFIGTGLGGIILAYVCYTTGSIYASMAAHFGFNLLPTIILWVSEPLRQLFPNSLVASMQTTAAYQIRGDLEAQVAGSTVTNAVLISGIGLALTLLLLRSITKRTAKIRPGLVMNYFGLAGRIDETSQTLQTGDYYGPNPRYAYGEYGFMYCSDVVATAWGNPNQASFNKLYENGSYVNQSQIVPPFKPAIMRLTQGGRASLAGIWFILLMLYAFGSYQELFLRVVGRDCQTNGFRHCEGLLPRSALVLKATDIATLPGLYLNK